MTLWPRPAPAQAQATDHFEIGALVGALDLRESVGEKPLTVGLRGGYRFNRAIGIEGEWIKCPGNGSGNFEQVLILGGVKVGPHFGPLGVLGRFRAGVLRLGSPGFVAFNGQPRTEPAVDVGVAVELRTGRHVAIRIDGGRTIVPFGSVPIKGPLPPYAKRLGTTVNPQGAFGVQIGF